MRSIPLLPPADSQEPDLPRGLMVFSAASFSLEPPLDMSAAMEKALAREESWGLGDAVNSMASSTRSCLGTGPAELLSSFPQGDKARDTAQSFRERSHGAAGDSGGSSPSLLRAPGWPRLSRPPQSPRAAEASSQPEPAGEAQPQAPPGAPPRAPQDQSLRRWALGTSISCAKTGGSHSTLSASFLPSPAAGCWDPAERR